MNSTFMFENVFLYHSLYDLLSIFSNAIATVMKFVKRTSWKYRYIIAFSAGELSNVYSKQRIIYHNEKKISF